MAIETKAQKNRFFQAVANNCKFRDAEVVKDVYYAMIRTILQECKTTGKILMPDFGTIVLHVMKPKTIRNINTGLTDISKEYRLLKFKMSTMLKNYLNKK